MDPKLHFCIVYRAERKKILHSQLDLIMWLIEYVESFSLCKDDYMKLTNKEHQEDDPNKAMLRRLKNREYLRQVSLMFKS